MNTEAYRNTQVVDLTEATRLQDPWSISGYRYTQASTVSDFGMDRSEIEYGNFSSPVWCALFYTRDYTCFGVTFGDRKNTSQISYKTALALAKQFQVNNFRRSPRVRFLQRLVPYSKKEQGW